MDDQPRIPSRDLVETQERLMRMLESVRLEKTAEEPVAPVQRTGCPQCHSLESWSGSQSCPNCGYHPKLGRHLTEEGSAGDQIAPPDFQRPAITKKWSWILFTTGVIIILGVSLGVCFAWPNPDDRVSWGRLQLLFGVCLAAFAHLQAYALVCRHLLSAPMASSAIVSISPFRPLQLWREAIRLLPFSRRMIYMGSWGMLAAVLAVATIGVDPHGYSNQIVQRLGETGQSRLVHMAKFFTASPVTGVADKSATTQVEQAEAIEDVPPQNDQQVSGEFVPNPPLDMTTPAPVLALPEAPPTSQGVKRSGMGEFHIFGYLTNPAGEMKSVLLAEIDDTRGRFVGRVSLHEASTSTREQLREMLDEHRASQPALRSAYQARWVRPVVVCNIAYTGWTAEGTLRDGFLMKYALRDSPVPLATEPNLTPVGDQRPLRARSTSTKPASQIP